MATRDISDITLPNGDVCKFRDDSLPSALDSKANIVHAHTISQVMGLQSALDGKQAKLTFDSTPTANSSNPVTSGGIKTALDSKQAALTFDSTPTADSSNPVTSKGIKAALDGKANSSHTHTIANISGLQSALDGKQAKLTFDSTPTANSSNPVTSAGIKTALDGKQNTLTFDSAPKANSTNPVTSGGIKTALDGKANTSHTHTIANVTGLQSALDGKQAKLTFDSKPTANSSNPVTSSGIKTALDGKQNTLTFDSAPKANSTNPVTSGGIKTALDGKANVSHTHTIADVTGLQSALDRKTDKPTWADLAIEVNQGHFAVQYDFGDQFSDTWVDKSASKSYDFVWDYVHKRDVTLPDGKTLTARPFLQMHYTTPYGVQFSHPRALTAVMYKTTSALTKGTGYNFTMPDGKYLNFTCPEAVEAGVWLGYNNGNIEVYNATGLNKSSEAPASISATASGTSLGNTPSMPAGTYSFIFASTWIGNVVAGMAVSFTIPSALSFGDRICGLYDAPTYSPSRWEVYTVTDSGKTLSDPIAVTVSDDGVGTVIGSMQLSTRVASLSFPLNSAREMAYGWNRWKTSAARQWLNSEAGVGAWWEAQDAFDIRPDELSTKPGFLSGFPAEFLNAIKRVEVKTFANTVNDGSSSSPTEDTTYDRVFLPSLTEAYVIEQKTEGQPFEYWKRRLGISSPQGWYGEHAMPERICYGVDNHTSPQQVRFRSANVDHACDAWWTNFTGGVYSKDGYRQGALRSCPVVVL